MNIGYNRPDASMGIPGRILFGATFAAMQSWDAMAGHDDVFSNCMKHASIGISPRERLGCGEICNFMVGWRAGRQGRSRPGWFFPGNEYAKH